MSLSLRRFTRIEQPRSLLRLHTAQYIIARDIHLKKRVTWGLSRLNPQVNTFCFLIGYIRIVTNLINLTFS